MTADATAVAEKTLDKKLDDLKLSDDHQAENNSNAKGDESEKKGQRRRYKLDPQSIEEHMKEWEDRQKSKVVLQKDVKGRVKWYSVIGHYGFIERDDGEGDVFVHQSAIANSSIKKVYHRSLADEQLVQFDLVQGEKGPEAVNVQGPDGTQVKPSTFKPFFTPLRRTLRKFRRFHGKKLSSLKQDDAEGEAKDEEKPRPVRRPFWRRPRQDKTDNEKHSNSEEKPKRERRSRRRRQKSSVSHDSKSEEVAKKNEEPALFAAPKN